MRVLPDSPNEACVISDAPHDFFDDEDIDCPRKNVESVVKNDDSIIKKEK